MPVAGTLLSVWLLALASGGAVVVEPDTVDVGIGFSGQQVVVTTPLQPGEQVAIELRGQEQSFSLKRKGRLLGLLWMNVADVDVDQAPAIYMLATSRPVAELAPPEELARLRLGRQALARSIRVKGEGAGAETLEQFFALKQAEGLYVWQAGRVDSDSGKDPPEARAEFSLPAKLPLGSYRVRAVAFRQGRGRELGQAELKLRQVGLVAGLRDLAREHGVLFGIGAVVLALVVGLLTGFLFGRGGGGGH